MALDAGDARAGTGLAGLTAQKLKEIFPKFDVKKGFHQIDASSQAIVEEINPELGGAPGPHAASHENGGGDEINVAGLSGVLADDQNPTNHAADHQNGGSDEINVGGLSGTLADPQTAAAHASAHENGGGDQISVAGLSGLLADEQNPTAHASDHQNGGSDEINVAGLSGVLADNQNPVPTAGADTTAIHDNVAAEISAVTSKPTPTTADLLLIEDAAAANAKKRITIGSLPAAAPASHAASHQNGGSDEINVAGLNGVLADDQNPVNHAADHQNGGGDEINVGGLSGVLADNQNAIPAAGIDTTALHDNVGGEILAIPSKGIPTASDVLVIEDVAALNDKKSITIGSLPAAAPASHAASHQNGGSDEINVAGLDGVLADDQNPVNHAADHQNGGGDEISVAGLSGVLADNQNAIPAAGIDTTALHDNVAGEIVAIPSKAIPTTADTLVIEDDAVLNDKKSITIGSLPAATPASHAASHQNGGSDEINVAGLDGVLADNQNPVPTAGVDTTAIHDNVGSEISAIAAKAIPSAADFLVIEDAGAGNAKRSITVGDLPVVAPAAHAASHQNGGSDEINVAGLNGVLADDQPAIPAAGIDTTAIHDNVDGEIVAVALKASPVVGDLLLIENAGAPNAKQRITIGSLPAAAPAAHAASHENGGSDEISVTGLSGLLADDQNPTAHAADHQNGGVDEINVGGLSGQLADNQPAIPAAGIDTTAIHDNVDGEIVAVTLKAVPVVGDLILIENAGAPNAKRRITIGSLPAAAPASHAASHQNGGSDEINVAGLNGLLADDQNPTNHAADHQNGGGDEINVGGLSGQLADDQPPLAHAADHQNGGLDEISVAGLSGVLADNQPAIPAAGIDTTAIHDNVGGEIAAITAKALPVTGDFLLIEDLGAGNVKRSITIGDLPAATPASHAASHQNGGSDEINVGGLSGVLADNQHPLFTTVKVAAYTAVSGELVRYNAAGPTFTISMPAAPSTNDRVGIKNVTTSAGLITLSGNGNNVEDPTSPGTQAISASIVGAGISLIYQYDGAEWWVV